MTRMQRTSPLAIAAFAVVGIAIGLLVQVARSSSGQSPLVPPVSLAATLMVISGVLIVLAVLLRRAVRPSDDQRGSKRAVNPFHAVRLLAGARAGQFSGALFAGVAAGSILQLFGRSVFPPSATWLPMVLMMLSGLVLVCCGVVAEMLCRVPPTDPDAETEGEGGEASGASLAP